jgi:hypothetical protein
MLSKSAKSASRHAARIFVNRAVFWDTGSSWCSLETIGGDWVDDRMYPSDGDIGESREELSDGCLDVLDELVLLRLRDDVGFSTL